MKDPLQRLKEHYEPRIKPDRLGYEILDWENQESQFCRFEVLLRRVSLQGKSLLDVGCGVGDLCAYLEAKNIEVAYTGVDILNGMVDEARRRCSEACFETADLLKEDPFGGDRFDIAFCSGIFNLETGNNEELLQRFLERLKGMTSEAVVINLLSVSSTDQNGRYHYFDPAVVIRWAEALYRDVEIDEGYLSNDFTLICRH